MEINPSFKYPRFLYEALFNGEKFTTITAGRRSGKTYNTIQWLIEEALATPDTSCIHIDTTQSNITKYFERYYLPILKGSEKLYTWNGQRLQLKFINGSYIDFGSAERQQNLEGFQYKRGLLNEAGIILKKESLWDNTLMPMFKGDDVQVKIIGTPKGKNKFYTLSRQYKYYGFSAYDSPFWKKEELDQIKKVVPFDVWQQEYLGQFLENASSVFRNIDSCIRDIKTKKGDIIAIDLAKHTDFTVIMVGNSKTKEVIEIDRFNQVDWGFQKQRIVNMINKYNRPKVIIDSTGVGDSIYDDLSKLNVVIEPYKFNSQNKTSLIQNLSVAIDNQEIFYPRNEFLLNELSMFGYEMSSAGNIRYNAPDGFHDDMVIALGLFNHLVRNHIEIKLSSDFYF